MLGIVASNVARTNKEKKMQILKLYSIRDHKGDFFQVPFAQKTHGEAERTFYGLVNDEKTNLNKYPEDYDLYYIGEFNDHTGKVVVLDTPQHMQKAVNVKKVN